MVSHFYEILVFFAILSSLWSLGLLLFFTWQIKEMKTQNKIFKNQTSNIKNDSELNSRSWIKINIPDPFAAEINGINYSAKDGNYRTHPKATIWYTFTVENIGKTPALDMTIWKCINDSQFKKKNFHEMVHTITKGVLLPGESRLMEFGIPNKKTTSLNNTPIFYGIHVKYLYNNRDYAHIGKIFKTTENSIFQECYWLDKPENFDI